MPSTSFAHLTALESLECDMSGVPLERLPPSLRELRLEYCSVPPSAAFRHLTCLRLLSCSVGELSSAAVASLSPSLEELDVGMTRLPVGVSLAHLPRLRVLRGGYDGSISNDTVASLPSGLVEMAMPGCRVSLLFAHLRALQTLTLCYSVCNDASLASLPPSLVTLDVSWCKYITPAAVLPAHLPALTTVTMNGTAVGDALVASLPAGLTKLVMVDCPRVTHGATLDHLPALRELRSSGTPLSRATLAACRARGCAASADGVLCGHTRDVSCLAVLPDGRLASGDEGGVVRLWDMARPSEPDVVVLSTGAGEAEALAVLPDGARLAISVGAADEDWSDASLHGVAIHKIGGDGGDTGARLAEGLRDVDAWSLAVLADGRLAAGCSDGNIRVVDVDAPGAAEMVLLAGHSDSVAALAGVAGGRLGRGSSGTHRRGGGGGPRTCVPRLAGYRGNVTALAALPDGRLASGEDGGTVRLWDVGTATCTGMSVLTGHTLAVTALAVLPDGRLASGSRDGSIWLWTVRHAAGSRLPASFVPGMLLALHLGGVAALVALPDGRLASGDNESIRLWRPPPPPPPEP